MIRECGKPFGRREPLATEAEIEQALDRFRTKETAYSDARERHGLGDLDCAEEAAMERSYAIEHELNSTVPTTPEGMAVKLRRLIWEGEFYSNEGLIQLAETTLEGFEALVGRTSPGIEKG